MKNLRIIFLIVIFISLFSIRNSYPALKDFKQDYEKEESSKSGGSGSGSYGSGGGGDECMGECTLFIFQLWFAANMYLEYDKYPYHTSGKNNFVCNYPFLNNSSAGRDPGLTETGYNDSGSGTGCFDGKKWFLTLEGGGQYAFDNGNGGFARLSGKIYKIIGPEFEAKRIVDDYGDHLDYYAAGVNIPIVQFSGFMPDFYIQAIFLKGVIERNGTAFGIIINSYPVKPLSFMLRFGSQSYGNIKGKDYGNMDFYDYEGRIGVILNRFEFFAGYRKIGSEEVKLGGPVAGIKIFL